MEEYGTGTESEKNFKFSITFRHGGITHDVFEQPSITKLSLPDLYKLRDATQEEIDDCAADEPEGDNRNEYNDWEYAVETLTDF